LADKPTFVGNSELARYVHPLQIDGTKHATPAAFLPSDDDLKDTTKAYLSVNSTEVESQEAIADYFRAVLQDGEGDVAIHTTKVQTYVNGGRREGVKIKYRPSESRWVFTSESGEEEDAFLHHEIRRSSSSGLPNSPSHCGVEFVRRLDDLEIRSLARFLAKSPRCHVYAHQS
jgi:hypothetical protein